MASRKSKVVSLSLAQGTLMVIGLVSGMVFSRTLTVEDYGTYLQTFVAYDFAVPLLTLGLPSALYYFLPGATERKKGLVLDNMILLLISGGIFSLFLVLGGTELLAKRFNNPNLAQTLNWMVLYPLYTFPIVLNTVLVIQDKVNVNAIYNVITGILLISSLMLAAFFTKSYEVPILIRIYLPLLFFPIAIYYTFKYIPGSWSMPSIGNMRKLLIFSVPLGFASVLGTLTRQLANVIVSFLSSPKEFAIYANGAKEVPLVGIVASSIAVVIMADMSKKIQEGDRQSALSLFKKASITSACFILPVMCFLMIYANNFIEILYTKKYIDSVTPFRIYLLILPIRIVYYGSAFVALGISKLILYRSAVELIITSILCYVFVKFFGAYSAALAIVVTLYFFSAPYNLFTLGKEFGCSAFQIIPFRMIGNILLLSVIAALPAAMILIIKLNPVVSLVLGGMVYSVAYALLAYKFVPDFRSVTIQSSDKIKSILKLKR